MGATLSTYRAVRELSESAQERGSSRILRSTRQFSLFSVVLHDAAIHTALEREIERKWEYLDAATGEHLLFFALARPPEDSLSRVLRQRPWERVAGRRRPLGSERHAAYQLALEAGVGDCLPCSLLSTDLTTAPVSETLAIGTIQKLGAVAQRLYEGDLRHPLSANDLIHDWVYEGLPGSWGEVSLRRSALAAMVADALAACEGASEHAGDVLQRLRREVGRLRGRPTRVMDARTSQLSC